MKKKKLLSLLLAGAMSASIFVGCGSSATDWDYISNKGELVIGVTYFEPMNYLDADGKLTGFETEFAEAVCEKMGVTPKFQKIDWDSKEVELNSKTIDCIWNGLTIDDDRKSTMDISTPYMENKQVMVAKSDVADKIKSADDVCFHNQLIGKLFITVIQQNILATRHPSQEIGESIRDNYIYNFILRIQKMIQSQR